MRPRPSLLSRWLEPFASGLWVFFLLVTVAIAAVWSCGIGDATLEKWVAHPDLRDALLWLNTIGDMAWITLAATNVYLCLAEEEGLPTARRWALIIVVAVMGLGWLTAQTGFPFGPVQFGRQLGVKFGPVPLGLALFWFAIIIGAREAMLRFFPRSGNGQIAFGMGVLAFLADLNLEPIAAKLRAFWFWRANPPTLPPLFDAPMTTPLAWGITVGAIAFLLREQNVSFSLQPRSWKPVAVFAIIQTVLLAAHIGQWVRG
jgi:uncharacterized membrane protein